MHKSLVGVSLALLHARAARRGGVVQPVDQLRRRQADARLLHAPRVARAPPGTRPPPARPSLAAISTARGWRSRWSTGASAAARARPARAPAAAAAACRGRDAGSVCASATCCGSGYCTSDKQCCAGKCIPASATACSGSVFAPPAASDKCCGSATTTTGPAAQPAHRTVDARARRRTRPQGLLCPDHPYCCWDGTCAIAVSTYCVSRARANDHRAAAARPARSAAAKLLPGVQLLLLGRACIGAASTCCGGQACSGTCCGHACVLPAPRAADGTVCPAPTTTCCASGSCAADPGGCPAGPASARPAIRSARAAPGNAARWATPAVPLGGCAPPGAPPVPARTATTVWPATLGAVARSAAPSSGEPCTQTGCIRAGGASGGGGTQPSAPPTGGGTMPVDPVPGADPATEPPVAPAVPRRRPATPGSGCAGDGADGDGGPERGVRRGCARCGSRHRARARMRGGTGWACWVWPLFAFV